MENKKKWMEAASVLLFLAALFLVEASPWGSMSVAQYNGGYGTFDMKSYDAAVVSRVLAQCTVKGITVMKQYYFCDYLFIAAFLIFQVMISTLVFKKVKSSLPRYLFISIAVIRAVADIIENALLLYVVTSYPAEHQRLVASASICTQIKIKMIPIWVIILIVGILFNFIKLGKRTTIPS